MHRDLSVLVLALLAVACGTDGEEAATRPEAERVAAESSPVQIASGSQTPSRHGPPDSSLFIRVRLDHPLIEWMLDTLPILQADTLFFYSAEFEKGWTFEGFPVDTTFYPLFQAEYAELADLRWEYPAVFASAQIPLGRGRTGFTVRGTGPYSATRVDLWVYDSAQARMLQVIPVAEGWGDAGDVVEEWGWLVDVDGDGRQDLVRRLLGTTLNAAGDTLPPEVFRDSSWVHIATESGEFDTLPEEVPRHLHSILDAKRWLRQ